MSDFGFDLDAVRSDGLTYIEIDVRKNRFPYISVRWNTDKKKWQIIADKSNGSGIPDAKEYAEVHLSNKKMRCLRDFLNSADLGDTDSLDKL
jgi:hypothetical protein